MSKRKLRFARLFVAALLAIVAALLVITACGPEGEDQGTMYTVKWDLNQSTVKVDDFDTPPESVSKGTVLTFAVEPEAGYSVRNVLRNGQPLTANKDTQKYSVTVNSNVTIRVNVERTVSDVEVKIADGVVFYAGDVIEEGDLTVYTVYADNEKETVAFGKYTVNYQDDAKQFELGHTSFTVTAGGKTVEVKIDAVRALVVIDAYGGAIDKSYVEALKNNSALSDVETKEEMVVTEKTLSGGEPEMMPVWVSFTFGAALTEDIALPTVSKMVTEYSLEAFKFAHWEDSDREWPNAISKELTVSNTYTAKYTTHFLEVTSVNYEVEEEIPYLVVRGAYKGNVNDMRFVFREGDRKVELVGEEKLSGTMNEDATWKFDMTAFLTAKAQDGGTFFGAWLDIKFRTTINGRVEEQEIFMNEGDIDKTRSVIIGGYRYGFEEWGGTLKATVTEQTPYEYTMKVEVGTDAEGKEELRLIFEGRVLNAKYYGMVVRIDWWITSTVDAFGDIDAAGNWKVEFVLNRQNGFVLDTLGYAHFGIYQNRNSAYPEYSAPNLDSDGNSQGNGNLVVNDALKNREDLTYHYIPHGQFTGDSLRIANSNETLVYYVGIPAWDAIVIYGCDESGRSISATEFALKVDNIENPTKVYYVITVEASIYSETELKAFKFGNIDGGENITYECEKVEHVFSTVYRLWFDVTAYKGGMLWANFYDAENFKIIDLKDDSQACNGLFAIVGDTKYFIACTYDEEKGGGLENTYNKPNLATTAAGKDEKNPETADPNKWAVVKQVRFNSVRLIVEDGRVYYAIDLLIRDYTEEDLDKSVLFDGDTNFAIDHKKDEGSGLWRLFFDVTDYRGEQFYPHLKFGDVTHDGGNGDVISSYYTDGKTISVNGFVYEIEFSWGMPTLKVTDTNNPDDKDPDDKDPDDKDPDEEDPQIAEPAFDMSASFQADKFILTIFGTVDKSFAGKYVDIDYEVNSKTHAYALIEEGGSFTVSFDFTNVALGTNIYFHFAIVENEGGKVLYQDGTDGNLLNTWWQGDAEDYSSRGFELLNGRAVRIANADETVVFYFGEGKWGGIVGYGLNEARFENVTGAALEEMEGKPYFVVLVRFNGYTEEELRTLYMDGYTYEFQSKAGSWPAVSIPEKTYKIEGSYFKIYLSLENVTVDNQLVFLHMREGGNGDGNFDNANFSGEPVVYGHRRFEIGTTWEEWAWNLVTVWVTPTVTLEGKVSLELDNADAPSKVYYVVSLNAPYDDIVQANIKFGNTDGQEIFNCDKVEIEGHTYKLYFDVTSATVEKYGEGVGLWSNIYAASMNNYKIIEIKDDTHSTSSSVEFGGKVYSILNTGDNGTWGSCNLKVNNK